MMLLFDQRDILGALKIPYNKVMCRSKRIGGGSGGKEFQSNIFAVIASAAANK